MKPFTEQKRNIGMILLSLLILALFWGVLFVLVGIPMLRMVEDPAAFRDWVQAHGIGGRAIFIGCMVFQVLVSVIPSEPLELGAGYAFGALEGTFLCMLGTVIGTAIIFAFVRRFGRRAVEMFITAERIDSFSFLKTERKLRVLVFLLYLIPGIPKDVVTWIVPLTRIRMNEFLLLSSIARIFAIVTSTVGGDAIGDGEYVKAIWVLAVTAAVSGLGYLGYHLYQKKRSKREKR